MRMLDALLVHLLDLDRRRKLYRTINTFEDVTIKVLGRAGVKKRKSKRNYENDRRLRARERRRKTAAGKQGNKNSTQKMTNHENKQDHGGAMNRSTRTDRDEEPGDKHRVNRGKINVGRLGSRAFGGSSSDEKAGCTSASSDSRSANRSSDTEASSSDVDGMTSSSSGEDEGTGSSCKISDSEDDSTAPSSIVAHSEQDDFSSSSETSTASFSSASSEASNDVVQLPKVGRRGKNGNVNKHARNRHRRAPLVHKMVMLDGSDIKERSLFHRAPKSNIEQPGMKPNTELTPTSTSEEIKQQQNSCRTQSRGHQQASPPQHPGYDFHRMLDNSSPDWWLSNYLKQRAGDKKKQRISEDQQRDVGGGGTSSSNAKSTEGAGTTCTTHGHHDAQNHNATSSSPGSTSSSCGTPMQNNTTASNVSTGGGPPGKTSKASSRSTGAASTSSMSTPPGAGATTAGPGTSTGGGVVTSGAKNSVVTTSRNNSKNKRNNAGGGAASNGSSSGSTGSSASGNTNSVTTSAETADVSSTAAQINPPPQYNRDDVADVLHFLAKGWWGRRLLEQTVNYRSSTIKDRKKNLPAGEEQKAETSSRNWFSPEIQGSKFLHKMNDLAERERKRKATKKETVDRNNNNCYAASVGTTSASGLVVDDDVRKNSQNRSSGDHGGHQKQNGDKDLLQGRNDAACRSSGLTSGRARGKDSAATSSSTSVKSTSTPPGEDATVDTVNEKTSATARNGTTGREPGQAGASKSFLGNMNKRRKKKSKNCADSTTCNSNRSQGEEQASSSEVESVECYYEAWQPVAPSLKELLHYNRRLEAECKFLEQAPMTAETFGEEKVYFHHGQDQLQHGGSSSSTSTGLPTRTSAASKDEPPQSQLVDNSKLFDTLVGKQIYYHKKKRYLEKVAPFLRNEANSGISNCSANPVGPCHVKDDPNNRSENNSTRCAAPEESQPPGGGGLQGGGHNAGSGNKGGAATTTATTSNSKQKKKNKNNKADSKNNRQSQNSTASGTTSSATSSTNGRCGASNIMGSLVDNQDKSFFSAGTPVGSTASPLISSDPKGSGGFRIDETSLARKLVDQSLQFLKFERVIKDELDCKAGYFPRRTTQLPPRKKRSRQHHGAQYEEHQAHGKNEQSSEERKECTSPKRSRTAAISSSRSSSTPGTSTTPGSCSRNIGSSPQVEGEGTGIQEMSLGDVQDHEDQYFYRSLLHENCTSSLFLEVDIVPSSRARDLQDEGRSSLPASSQGDPSREGGVPDFGATMEENSTTTEAGASISKIKGVQNSAGAPARGVEAAQEDHESNNGRRQGHDHPPPVLSGLRDGDELENKINIPVQLPCEEDHQDRNPTRPPLLLPQELRFVANPSGTPGFLDAADTSVDCTLGKLLSNFFVSFFGSKNTASREGPGAGGGSTSGLNKVQHFFVSQDGLSRLGASRAGRRSASTAHQTTGAGAGGGKTKISLFQKSRQHQDETATSTVVKNAHEQGGSSAIIQPPERQIHISRVAYDLERTKVARQLLTPARLLTTEVVAALAELLRAASLCNSAGRIDTRTSSSRKEILVCIESEAYHGSSTRNNGLANKASPCGPSPEQGSGATPASQHPHQKKCFFLTADQVLAVAASPPVASGWPSAQAKRDAAQRHKLLHLFSKMNDAVGVQIFLVEESEKAVVVAKILDKWKCSSSSNGNGNAEAEAAGERNNKTGSFVVDHERNQEELQGDMRLRMTVSRAVGCYDFSDAVGAAAGEWSAEKNADSCSTSSRHQVFFTHDPASRLINPEIWRPPSPFTDSYWNRGCFFLQHWVRSAALQEVGILDGDSDESDGAEDKSKGV
ncbi:unnamed protein product [Amoebophrya sp. A120]|nr:unnamed protein product [Amoebophrya sp. A120]|eukprot:GSA120T00000964001.1